jgi:spore germination protein
MKQGDEIVVYSVGYKETLSDILRKFDISIRDIIESNGSCDLLSLKEGQTLLIRNKEKRGHGYMLQENDTLSSVAEKFQISVLSLLKANPNFMPNEIRQGIRIALPNDL